MSSDQFLQIGPEYWVAIDKIVSVTRSEPTMKLMVETVSDVETVNLEFETSVLAFARRHTQNAPYYEQEPGK